MNFSSWIIKWIEFEFNAVRKIVLKVEYTDQLNVLKLRGFPFSLRTNTVDHFVESKIWKAEIAAHQNCAKFMDTFETAG